MLNFKKSQFQYLIIAMYSLMASSHGTQAMASAASAPLPAQAQVQKNLMGLLVFAAEPSPAKAAAPAPVAAPARQLCRDRSTTALGAQAVDPAQLAQWRTQLVNASPNQRVLSQLPAELLTAESVQKALSPFLGRPINQELTQGVVDAMVALTAGQNRYLADVYFSGQANQQVRDGILVLIVQPATVGRVIAQGQQHTPAQELECRISLPTGSWVDLKQIESDIQTLNYNSRWRATSLRPQLRPGDQPGSTDIVLNTQDEKPVRYTVGMDNTGNRTSDLDRVRAGVSLGHVGGRFDHQLDYNFAASPDLQKFRSHSMAYGMPLPSGDRLTLRGDYISTDIMLAGNAFHFKGDNTILSAEWSRLLSAQAAQSSFKSGEVYGGAEVKRIGSALAFGQTAVNNNTVQVAQFFGGWRNDWRHTVGNGQTDLRGTWSPGNLLGLNDDASYDAVRPGAKAQYWRVNASLGQNFELPKSVAPRWQISTRLTAQMANAPLIASERMGLSGSQGVRGYYQDTLFSDAGVVGTLELQSPRWTVPVKAVNDLEMQFIAFADAGHSRNATVATNTDLNINSRIANISSQGVGLRLTKQRHFSVRADAARRNSGLSNDKTWFWHLSAQAAF
jgi:hemolysin activation/secretion protein